MKAAHYIDKEVVRPRLGHTTNNGYDNDNNNKEIQNNTMMTTKLTTATGIN